MLKFKLQFYWSNIKYTGSFPLIFTGVMKKIQKQLIAFYWDVARSALLCLKIK